MTKQEILARLESFKKDRQWLAEAIGYSYDYIKNSLAPAAPEPSPKFSSLVERAFSEEERRREVDLSKPGSSVWDLVYFNGHEMEKIDRAKKNGGYQDLPTFYRDAVIDFADRLLAEEAATEEKDQKHVQFPAPARRRKIRLPNPEHVASGGEEIYELAVLGGIAAGLPMEGDFPNTTILLRKDYGPGHYVLRVFGNSMEPGIPDGSYIVVKENKDRVFPRKKSIVVYSGPHGATLKEYNTRKALPGEEEHSRLGKVAVLLSHNPLVPEVKITEGGEIQAFFVEIVEPILGPVK